MSYILDALKRSEQERRQGQIPSVVAPNTLLHVSQRRPTLWPYLLIGVLLLNALVYAFFSWYSAQSVLPSDTQESLAAPAVPSISEVKTSTFSPIAALQTHPDKRLEAHSVTPSTDHLMPSEQQGQMAHSQDLAPSPAAEGEFDDEVTEPIDYEAAIEVEDNIDPYATELADADVIRPKVAAEQPVLDPVEPEVVSDSPELQASPELEPQTVKAAGPYEQVPQLSDLSLEFQKTVPDMAFNSHIYSANPSARRVMINSNYLREGQHFSGLEVVEIGELNIVLRANDVLFKMPALRDWTRP